MAHSDARQAIIERLTRPPGRLLSERPSAGGWTAQLRRAGGAEADPSTIRFLKERSVGGKQLHAVAFQTIAGHSRHFVIGVVHDRTGAWEVSGMAGGGGSDPHRDRPWVNFAGWGWPGGFSGGGRVVGSGCEEATRVRLRFKNGVELEDTVDDGLVLFIADRVVKVPASADILDSAGLPMASHPAFT